MAAAPPREPPPALLSAYTLGGTVPLSHFYVDDSQGGLGTHYKFSARDMESLVLSAETAVQSYRSSHYGRGAALPPLGSSHRSNRLWIVRALEQLSLSGLHVAVFGTVEPWVEALAVAMGASRVTTIEYNQLTIEHPRIRTLTVAQSESTDVEADVAVSLSSFDHDGLGRYGDPLDPEGDLRAMQHAWRALRPGGRLLLSVPVGPDALVWNLHRRYGAARLPLLLRGWAEEGRVGWEESRLTAAADVRRSYEPLFILRRNDTGASGRGVADHEEL